MNAATGHVKRAPAYSSLAAPALGFATLVGVFALVEVLIRAGVINRFVVPLPSQVLAAIPRIIAEEGDQVRIVDGRVFRNDVPLDDSFVPQEYRSHDDWGPQVIPEGYYFVMGDHRNNSSDSRHWGFVPKKYIIGKVQLRWWPMGHAQVF